MNTCEQARPQHRGLRPLLFSNSDVCSLTSPTNLVWEGVGDKTRSSELRQGVEHSQHDLTSYFKTLIGGPAGIWTHSKERPWRKLRILRRGNKTHHFLSQLKNIYLPRSQGARPGHVQVQSSNCCCSREYGTQAAFTRTQFQIDAVTWFRNRIQKYNLKRHIYSEHDSEACVMPIVLLYI